MVAPAAPTLTRPQPNSASRHVFGERKRLVVVPHPPLKLRHLLALDPDVRPLDGHHLAHIQEADQVRPGQTNIRLLAPVYAEARLKLMDFSDN